MKETVSCFSRWTNTTQCLFQSPIWWQPSGKLSSFIVIVVYNLIHQTHKVTCRFSFLLFLCASEHKHQFNSDLVDVVVVRLITANRRIYFYLIFAYCWQALPCSTQGSRQQENAEGKDWNPKLFPSQSPAQTKICQQGIIVRLRAGTDLPTHTVMSMLLNLINSLSGGDLTTRY